jgi:hypothetical protein
LVHPARLQIVEALIDKGVPLAAEELIPLVPAVEGNTDLLRYHVKAMTEAGVLEVAGTDPRPEQLIQLSTGSGGEVNQPSD